jgi:dihydrofolate reductase
MGLTLLSMSVSLDGFAAGPDVAPGQPMGRGGERLHEWLFQPDVDRAAAADGVSPIGVDAQHVRELTTTTGAVVIGRRTFDVGLDLWQDTPFPVPCFVITHEARVDLLMKSAPFTFVADGIDEALHLARQAAGERNVLVMGGPTTAAQFVRARLVDEIRLQLVPVLLGGGTRLFDRLGDQRIELEQAAVIESPRVTHLRYRIDVGGGTSPHG